MDAMRDMAVRSGLRSPRFREDSGERAQAQHLHQLQPVVRTQTDFGGLWRLLPSLLRAATRSLPVWLIGVTALALSLYLWLRASPVPSSQSLVPGTDRSPLSRARFEFDMVTVDARGAAVERKRGSAQIYEEDLGGGVKLAMVAIPGGQFVMGSPSNEASRNEDEGPQRSVTVAPFFLGQFEVTQAQWRVVARWAQVARVLAEVPARFKGDDLPVESVSWDDAVEFCARLSRRTGSAYRLPSEAEWEYAARAGTTTPFHFGATITPALVNYDSHYPYAQAAKGEYRARTTPVGSLSSGNAFGLFDMHGNVWEWVEDDWHESYKGAPLDSRAWAAPRRGSGRVIRGGSWYYSAGYSRAACRFWLAPGDRFDYLGFRCARSHE
jgi:formylglycine-generating enzyme required for sulfatase activity